MQVKDVKIGKVYDILHKRKGAFVAQLIDLEECDEVDPVVMVMKYDVRAGTAQAGMATTPKQAVRVSGIRPSLVVKIEETDGGSWLRDVKVPEEEKVVEKEPGFWNRLKNEKGFVDKLLGRN